MAHSSLHKLSHPDETKDFYQPTRLEEVAFIVGWPGPDIDYGIFLRREGDDYVVWSQVWNSGEFTEQILGRVWPIKKGGYSSNVAEIERLKSEQVSE